MRFNHGGIDRHGNLQVIVTDVNKLCPSLRNTVAVGYGFESH